MRVSADLPKIVGTSLIVCIIIFFFLILPGPVDARLLVKDGIKLPLVASENTVFPQISGRVLVSPEKEEEPPSAYEIIRSRSFWRGRQGKSFSSLLVSSPAPTPTPEPTKNLFFTNPTPRLRDLIDSALKEFTDRPASFSSNLTVLGQTNLAATAISGPLLQDGTLLITEGKKIDAPGETLFLQSEGLGGVDFVAGKMRLDAEGNLVVENTASFVQMKTDLVSPLKGKEIKVEGGLDVAYLRVQNQGEFGSLQVKGRLDLWGGLTVHSAPVEIIGSLSASDYLRVRDLIIDRTLTISRSSPSIGTAVLKKGTREILVANSKVNLQSRIFLTVDTANQPFSDFLPPTLFVSQKVPFSYFVVSATRAPEEDLTFHWLMVN